jgi:hypothetical protein
VVPRGLHKYCVGIVSRGIKFAVVCVTLASRRCHSGLNDKMRKCASAAHQEKVAMLNRAVNAAEQGAPPVDEEAAKAFVMAAIARGVEEGHAAITRLESGVLELRFATGELFHLSDEGITRIV